MSNKNIPSFTYENDNKKKKSKKIVKSLSNKDLKNMNLSKLPFPNNDIIKIIPVHSNNCQKMKTNNSSNIIPPNISQIFEMLIKNEVDENDDLEDINKFTINKNTKYDEIDTNINTLDTLIQITNNLDINKKYTFDINKLKKLITPLKKLKEFVGMTNIKDNIIKQILYYLQNLDEDLDLMHTIITGPPGVGKTKLAYVLAEMNFKKGDFININIFSAI